MLSGLIDADLGGGVVKKRVALPGRGKRGSARTIVATRYDTNWFFIYGFEKNEHDNISQDELDALKGYAGKLLFLSDSQLSVLIAEKRMEEIAYGK